MSTRPSYAEMAAASAAVKQQEQAQRFARYCELRDQGNGALDAANEIGIGDTTRKRYERSYRLARGLTERDRPRSPYSSGPSYR